MEAIFLVTNFWEHLLSGKSAVQAGEAEAAQALTVAKIADKLPHLKRFIWSTLPGNAEGVSSPNGYLLKRWNIKIACTVQCNEILTFVQQTKRTVVQHFDFKAQVDVKIKNQYPQLAAKTTFLYVGYYATNLSEMPFAKFFTIPMSFGTYLWMSPVPRDTIFPSAGDTSVNVGVFVKAILAQPEKTLGKYATLVADTPTQADIVDLWSAATGKRAAYLQVNAEDWGKAFGEVGDELYANLKCFYDNPRWAFDNNALTGKDLGIEKELVGTKECLEKYKERLL